MSNKFLNDDVFKNITVTDEEVNIPIKQLPQDILFVIGWFKNKDEYICLPCKNGVFFISSYLGLRSLTNVSFSTIKECYEYFHNLESQNRGFQI